MAIFKNLIKKDIIRYVQFLVHNNIPIIDTLSFPER
jgi:hypothetical protein